MTTRGSGRPGTHSHLEKHHLHFCTLHRRQILAVQAGQVEGGLLWRRGGSKMNKRSGR